MFCERHTEKLKQHNGSNQRRQITLNSAPAALNRPPAFELLGYA
jgi:hypothetical protein